EIVEAVAGVNDRRVAGRFDLPGYLRRQGPIHLEGAPAARVVAHELDHATRDVLAVDHVEQQRGDIGIGEHGLGGDLLPVGELDTGDDIIADDHAGDGSAEANATAV